MEKYKEVGFVLLMRCKTEGLCEGRNTWLDLLKDGANGGVYGFEICLVVGSVYCTVPS